MASVRLNNNMRDDVRATVTKLAWRSDYYLQTYLDEMVADLGFKAQKDFALAIWREYMGEEYTQTALRIQELGQDLAATGHATSAVLTSTSVMAELPFLINPTDNDYIPRQNQVTLRLNFPDPIYGVLSSYVLRSELKYTAIDGSNKYFLPLTMYRHKTQKIRSNRQEKIDLVMRVMNHCNTGGQIRREWPGLIDFLPDRVVAELGQTVAKGKKSANKDSHLPDEAQKKDVEMFLSEMLMLPEVESAPSFGRHHSPDAFGICFD